MSDAAMSSGARLRSAREQRGMSTEKAAGELHLEPWVIESLEAGDYQRIGPSVYGKGFLRRYALLLELPVEEILAGYGLSVPVATQAPAIGAARVAQGLPAVTGAQVLGGVAAAALLVGLLWWRPWTRAAHSTSPDEPPETVAGARTPELAPEAPAPADAPGAASAAVPAAHAVLAEHTAGSTPADAGAGHAHLRLSFTADSWVEVHDALGNKSFAGNGLANTVRNIAGQAPMHVYLRLGNGVQLEINGRTVAIGPQFFAGDIARFQAGADGVLRREPPREASAANRRPPG